MPQSSYPLPHNEKFRLEKLWQYRVLDTEPEPAFDRITGLAKSIFDVPIVLISFLDKNRQFFKACIGIDVNETEREVAFCTYTILGDEPMIVPDAQADTRFKNNPLVTGKPYIRFYAGCPLTTSDGYNIGTLCLIDNKPREKFSKQQADQLNDLANVIVDELDLRLSKLKQERENIMKTEFLANMSHEIRTPLNGIIGTASILKETLTSDEDRSFVDIILISGDQLLTIINDILDLSKIEAGEIDAKEEKFDLYETLTELVDLYKSQAGGRKLYLKLEYGKNLPQFIVSDAYRIKQIIGNFISNAIKFTYEGGIILNANLDDNKNIIFSVRDTGEGIPKDKIPLLFERFYQAKDAGDEHLKGTGLGLAIAKSLAEILGGSIGVESEPDKGSTFWLSLPFKKAQHVEMKESADTGNNPESQNSAGELETVHNHNIKQFKGAKILIVEDDEVNRLIFERMLEKSGADFQTAENGQIAVEKAAHNSYDLIFMDLRMPVMNGIEATRKIKEILTQRKEKTYIVALTAHALNSHKEQAYEAGVDDFLTKPLKFEVLQDTLSKWLG